MLMNEFMKDNDWDKDKITKISNDLGLSEAQVYKWHWD